MKAKIYEHLLKKRQGEPVNGDLRIWWIPQVPGEPFYWPVTDLHHAANMLEALAAYDDFQYANKIKPDYSNVGGLQQFDGNEWNEWESEDGEDFDSYLKRWWRI